MSKSLKKLIDINRLREFKNKLVGTGSAYVQTGAVDQTVAGTKTFSKPIVGSVTGSSGSCTGNAATATRADSAANADTATNANYANSAGSVAWGNVSGRPTAVSQFSNDSGYITTDGAAYPRRVGGVTMNFNWSGQGGQPTWLWGGEDGTNMYVYNPANFSVNYATNAGYTNWLRTSSHTDHLFHTEWDGSYFWTYVTAGDGGYRAVRVERSNSSGYADSAGSAIKLATARTIALSGAATGTATGFDGTANITIPVTALAASAIRAQWYAAYPDGAEAHNAMWGGRDITAAFDSGEFSEHVADGTFRDIFPGDYITKSITVPPIFTTDSPKTYTVNWMIADCDYWINKGDQGKGMTAHHVVIVPQTPIFDANMNNDNVTTGGYASSWMHTAIIPTCATGIVNAFGSSHILTFRDNITYGVDNAVSSGLPQMTGTSKWWGQWVSAQCNLMSEKMVYGAPICSAGAADNVMATRQMSAFRLSEKAINYNRTWYWLRDVVFSQAFAVAYGTGDAHAEFASGLRGVRPFALLR